MRRVQSIVILVAAVVFLLVGAGQSGAIVLCRGVDGHVEVEVAAEGVCKSDADRASDRIPADGGSYAPEHGDEHCGPCVDLPLSIGVGQEASILTRATGIEDNVSVASYLFKRGAPAATPVRSLTRASVRCMAAPMSVSLRSVTLRI